MTRMYTFAGILAALMLAFGLFGWRMHSRGWDAATAHYKAVVDSALAANATQAKAIDELKAANAQWASAAKANADRVNQALAQVKATQDADAKALAAAQAKLHEVEHAHDDARTWAADRVPDPVMRELCQAADCSD